jgi:hypothetical protein
MSEQFMSDATLRLCSSQYSSAYGETIEESANRAYAMGQATTMDDIARIAYGDKIPQCLKLQICGRLYIETIERVLETVDFPLKPFDKFRQDIDLHTQTKKLSLLILSTQNVHRVFTEHLVTVDKDERDMVVERLDQHFTFTIGHLVDPIQCVLNRIRPSIDKKNAKIIIPALQEFLPSDLGKVVAQYMD